MPRPTGASRTGKSPDTFARDAGVLIRGGYKMEKALAIDQFHWTRTDFLTANLAAVDHAFTTPAIKAQLRQQLHAAYQP